MENKTFISTTPRGVARAVPNGDGWAVEHLLDEYDVRRLAADLHNRDTVYAGTQGDGLLRSDDRGKTWQPAGMAGQVVKSIAFSRAEPGVIYVGAKPPAIYVSRDGGQSWTELESFRQMRQKSWFTPAEPGDPYVQGLAVSPTDPRNIVAGIEYGAMLRSTDGGQTWYAHLKRTSRDCHSLIFHATDGDWVYQAGGGWAAAVSRDGGETWRQPRRGMGWSIYGWTCAADPQRPEVWYVSAAPPVVFPHLHMFPRMHWDGHANSFIFRATEKGRWERLAGGLPQPLDYAVYALLTDPNAPGHVYAGLSNGDVWHSANYGDNWKRLPLNLAGIHRSLVML